MRTPHGYTIESADLQTATDAEVAEIAQFRQELAVEERPEDPPTPLKVIEQWLRARPPGQWRAIFVARDSVGVLTGYGVAARNLTDTENAHIRGSESAVKPRHRRAALRRPPLARLPGSFEVRGD